MTDTNLGVSHLLVEVLSFIKLITYVFILHVSLVFVEKKIMYKFISFSIHDTSLDWHLYCLTVLINSHLQEIPFPFLPWLFCFLVLPPPSICCMLDDCVSYSQKKTSSSQYPVLQTDLICIHPLSFSPVLLAVKGSGFLCSGSHPFPAP